MGDTNYSVNCGFFNAVSNDRLYSADDMNRPYKRIISNGVFATPQGTPSTDLMVVANAGMGIICKKGEGLFADKWFEAPADINITVPSNSALLPRMDSVIAQIDTRQTGRIGQIVYRTGIPASSPQPPAINTTEGVKEYRIANVTVNAGVTSISQANINDRRGSADCPWITSLIQQVDTSTLYAQWNAKYGEYYEQETERFEAFMRELTEELTVSTAIVKIQSTYITNTTTDTIPIGISGFQKNRDMLFATLYVGLYGIGQGGLLLLAGRDFTISDDSTTITLTDIGAVAANTRFDFLCIKSVIIADVESTLEAVNDIAETVSGLQEDIVPLLIDSGWQNLTLAEGVQADPNNIPKCRLCGNRVYVRGMVKVQSLTDMQTLAYLPSGMYGNGTYYFTQIATDLGVTSFSEPVMFMIDRSYLRVRTISTISADMQIPLDTEFLID